MLDANELLSKLSKLDGLTGLANRRHFDEILHAEWSRAVRARNPLSALMIDIDFFKGLNDRYGHRRGDECLRRVAGALLDPPHRAYNTVARYGGEEFIVLLPETKMTDAMRIAEAIRHGVRKLNLENLGAVGDVVTVSIGVASQIPDLGDDVGRFIEAADCALYAAKRGGRDRVMMFCPSFNPLNPLQADICGACGIEHKPTQTLWDAAGLVMRLTDISCIPMSNQSEGSISISQSDCTLEVPLGSLSESSEAEFLRLEC